VLHHSWHGLTHQTRAHARRNRARATQARDSSSPFLGLAWLDYKIYQTKDLVIKSCQKLGKKYLPQIWQAKCEVLANFNNKPNGSKKKLGFCNQILAIRQ